MVSYIHIESVLVMVSYAGFGRFSPLDRTSRGEFEGDPSRHHRRQCASDSISTPASSKSIVNRTPELSGRKLYLGRSCRYRAEKSGFGAYE